MNETEMWILGLVLAGLGACIIGAAGIAWSFQNRLTRLETAFELMGSNTLKAMHSPDDHLEMDGLVEKYIMNGNDLPMEDWETVLESCTVIAADTSRPREDRLAAGLAAAFAEHKLARFAHLKKIIPE